MCSQQHSLELTDDGTRVMFKPCELCTCTHTHTYTHTRTHTRTRTHARVHVNTCTYTGTACQSTYLISDTFINLAMYALVKKKYTTLRINKKTQTHIHTHAHTHAHALCYTRTHTMLKQEITLRFSRASRQAVGCCHGDAQLISSLSDNFIHSAPACCQSNT